MSNMQRRDFVRRVGVAGLLGLGAAPFAFAAVKPDAKSALLVVDVQNCFVTGGTLPVKEGEAVVPIINKLSNAFENVIVTQDWHTAGHVSFASAHSGKKPFETTKLAYGNQVLWTPWGALGELPHGVAWRITCEPASLGGACA